MIVSIYIEDHEYLFNAPQTINFGGQYLYSFERKDSQRLLINRSVNEKYIPDFFNISDSSCKVDLLSAIVGQNGAGKSTILDVIRSIFIEHSSAMAHSTSTVLVEISGETRILKSSYNYVYFQDETGDAEGVSTIHNRGDYQSIYYSPHFDLKYNYNFDEVDRYDISLDKHISMDLQDVDKKGTNDNGWKFSLDEELVFKNSMRQVEFLNSSVFQDIKVFREVFDLPHYETGILHFRDVEIPKLWNTPSPLRPIINLIFKKLEEENKNWHRVRDDNLQVNNQFGENVTVNAYLLERNIVKAFLSVVINQMEKKNTWLEEGRIIDPYDTEKFNDSSSFEVFEHFISNSFIERGKYKHEIFKAGDILAFFENLRLLISKETNPDFIKRQSIRLNLEELKEVLELHKKIIVNLFHYYPLSEGLIDQRSYIEGFISFRPTDKNMSSGENALLNFFSKLYGFIQGKLVDESKFLPNKTTYILLLDEADLGFHPIWKKKYIDAILKTIPYFFEYLSVKPNVQILITTHDPLTLSDIPVNNVVFLQKEDGYCEVISEHAENKIQKTFGANITDLLSHSFFIDSGLIGDFSKSKIKEVIEWINSNKTSAPKRLSTLEFTKQLEYYKSIVNLIDEKIVRVKLAEMITDLVPDDDYYNHIIDDEIRVLRNKRR